MIEVHKANELLLLFQPENVLLWLFVVFLIHNGKLLHAQVIGYYWERCSLPLNAPRRLEDLLTLLRKFCFQENLLVSRLDYNRLNDIVVLIILILVSLIFLVFVKHHID
jgi:hypothetical protein